MRTILVDENNVEYFAQGIPLDLLQGDILMIGAVEGEMILGRILVQMEKECMNIAYLHVSEDFRNIGVASALLNKVELVRDELHKNLPIIAIYEGEDVFARILNHIFVTRGYETEAGLQKAFILSRDFIEQSPVFNRSTKKEMNEVVRFDTLTEKQLEEYLKMIGKSQDPLAPGLEDIKEAAPDVSYALVKDGKIQGSVLVMEGDLPGEYVVTYIFISKDYSAEGLSYITCALKDLMEKTKDLEKLIFTCADEKIENVVTSLFTEEAYYETYMVNEAVLYPEEA